MPCVCFDNLGGDLEKGGLGLICCHAGAPWGGGYFVPSLRLQLCHYATVGVLLVAERCKADTQGGEATYFSKMGGGLGPRWGAVS